PTGGIMNLNYSYQAAAGQMGAGTTAGDASQLMAINNNSSIGGSTETWTLTYDLEDRIVTSSQTSNGETNQRRYEYDACGNRTAVWDATSGGDQLQSVTYQQSGGAPTNQINVLTEGDIFFFTYDAAGNVTYDGNHTYQYDAENRLEYVDTATNT